LSSSDSFGHLHRLRVDVHAVDVIQQDALALADGQPPLPAAVLIEPGVASRRPLSGLAGPAGAVGEILGQEPVQQNLIGAQQEGAGAARHIQNPDGPCFAPSPGSHARGLAQRQALQQLDQGLPYDGVYDVAGRVEDPAGLAHLRLLLHDSPVPGRQADDLAQELLVDLAQDVGWQHRELVGAVGVIQVLEDVAQDFVVDFQPRSHRVRRITAAPLWVCLEEEQAGVVARVRVPEAQQ